MIFKCELAILTIFLVNHALSQTCNKNEKCVLKINCKNSDGRGVLEKRIEGGEVCDLTNNVCCNLKNIKVKSDDIKDDEDEKTECGTRYQHNVDTRIDATGEEDNEIEAEYGEFPWMINVMKNEEIGGIIFKVQFSGGSLIHPQMVLTSAHKFYKLSPETFLARGGEWDLASEDEIYLHIDKEVQEIILHPQYDDENLHYDIALLQLKEPFMLNRRINTICLPPKGLNFDNELCVASGWGKDKPNGNYQNILKKIDLPMVPSDKCQAMFRKTKLGEDFVLDESLLCAGGEKGKDTCHGDGGSPLVCRISQTANRYYQSGVVAYGIGCGDEHIPATYANIQLMREWIDDEMLGKVFDSSYYTYTSSEEA